MTATAMVMVRDLAAAGWPGGFTAAADDPATVTAMVMVGDLLASDWRPDLHPRDRHGRWAHKDAIPGLPGPAGHVSALTPDPVLGDRAVALFRNAREDNVRQPLADAVKAYKAGHPYTAQDHLDVARQHAQENGRPLMAVEIGNLRRDMGAKHGQAFRKRTLPKGEIPPAPPSLPGRPATAPGFKPDKHIREMLHIRMDQVHGTKARNQAMHALWAYDDGHIDQAMDRLGEAARSEDAAGHTELATGLFSLANQMWDKHLASPAFYSPRPSKTMPGSGGIEVGQVKGDKWAFVRTPKAGDWVTDAHGDQGTVFGVSGDKKWVAVQFSHTEAGGFGRREIIHIPTGEARQVWYAKSETPGEGQDWIRVKAGGVPLGETGAKPAGHATTPLGSDKVEALVQVMEGMSVEHAHAGPDLKPYLNGVDDALNSGRYTDAANGLSAAIAKADSLGFHPAAVRMREMRAKLSAAGLAGPKPGRLVTVPRDTPPETSWEPGTTGTRPVGRLGGTGFVFDRAPRTGDPVADNWGTPGKVAGVSGGPPGQPHFVAIEYEDGRHQVVRMQTGKPTSGKVFDTWFTGQEHPDQDALWRAITAGREPGAKPPPEPKGPPAPPPKPGTAPAELAKDVTTGPSDEWQGALGAQARTTFVQFPDGDKGVHKKFFDWDDGSSAEDMASAEYLSAQVAEAVGAKAPPVIRGKDSNEVWMGFVDGQVAETYLDEQGIDPWNPPTAMFSNDAGYRIGLLDYLDDNNDRHMENYMFTPAGEPVAIDNSSTWGIEAGGQTGPFRDALGQALAAGDNPFDAAALAAIKKRIDALEPQFKAAGHDDWWKQAEKRLADVKAGHL